MPLNKRDMCGAERGSFVSDFTSFFKQTLFERIQEIIKQHTICFSSLCLSRAISLSCSGHIYIQCFDQLNSTAI